MLSVTNMGVTLLNVVMLSVVVPNLHDESYVIDFWAE
jgi:hypothetical protein